MNAPKRAMKTLKLGLSVAVIIGLLIAAVKYLQGDEILAALRAFHWRYMPLMLLSALVALLLRSWRFQLLVQAVYQNISWKIPWKVFLAGQPALMLPGGAAAQVGLMKQAGADVGRSSAPVVISGLLDQTVLMAGSILAALWFEPARMPVLISLAVMGLVALLLWWKPTRTPILQWVHKRAAHLKLGHSLDNFVKVLPTLMAPALLMATWGITLVSHLMKFAVLVLAAWGLGVDASYGSLFLAFVVPSLLGRYTPLPAGIGVIDAGMVGFLSAAGHINTNQAAALVALFRVVTVFLPVVAGSVVYFLLWRGRREAAGRASVQTS